MRQQARRESARAWVASGAPVSVKAFGRRYGVDCYTAYADLIAIGVRLGPGDSRWAVRPARAPKRPPGVGSLRSRRVLRYRGGALPALTRSTSLVSL
jgi:hypothetical protein